jgi:hypothetical protein
MTVVEKDARNLADVFVVELRTAAETAYFPDAKRLGLDTDRLLATYRAAIIDALVRRTLEEMRGTILLAGQSDVAKTAMVAQWIHMLLAKMSPHFARAMRRPVQAALIEVNSG